MQLFLLEIQSLVPVLAGVPVPAISYPTGNVSQDLLQRSLSVVSPPQLPVGEYTQPYYDALTAPVSSPNSHLLVTTGCQNFFWRVGSHTWLECSPHIAKLKQIVVFKGQVFSIDYSRMLFTIRLVPQICIQKLGFDGREA